MFLTGKLRVFFWLQVVESDWRMIMCSCLLKCSEMPLSRYKRIGFLPDMKQGMPLSINVMRVFFNHE